MYRKPLAVLQLQARAKRAADGVTEALRALGRGELHTERGSLLLKKLSQRAGAIELVETSSLPRYLASHVSAGWWASCNWLTDFFLLSLMRGRGVQGGCATQRQNHESADTVYLRPGAWDHSAGGAHSRGRRVPSEGVLLLIALLARWPPDDEDRKRSCQ